MCIVLAVKTVNGAHIYRRKKALSNSRSRLPVQISEPGRRLLWRQPPTLSLYYEGKMMKTIFPQNYVYVLRTATTHHMVSFIDFYCHFLANFQTKFSPHMFPMWASLKPGNRNPEFGIQKPESTSSSNLRKLFCIAFAGKK